MPQPHLAAFSAVRRALAPYPQQTLHLVACSGGADSLALAVVAAEVAKVENQRVGAVIIDHQLQPGSAQVAERAAAQCRGLGLEPVSVVSVQVGQEGGLEAAARDARYAALEQARQDLGAATVLLGHTMDDQAETVLLGLARGSGSRSLQGMAPARSQWLRPLLELRRADTELICAVGGLQVWHDPTNQVAASGPQDAHGEDYVPKRSRVRHQLLPLAEQVLGPGVVPALARTAELLQADNQALDQWAEQEFDRLILPDAALRAADLATLPAAVATRVIRCWLLAQGARPGDLKLEHLRTVHALVTNWRGQGPISVPGPLRVHRSQGMLKVD